MIDLKVAACDREDAVISNPSTEEDIAEAISQIKCNKAPGAHEITTELLKLGGERMIQRLTWLSQQVWLNEEVPADWTTQLIVPLQRRVVMMIVTTSGASPYSVFQERSLQGFSEQNKGKCQQVVEGELLWFSERVRLHRPVVFTTHVNGTCT